MTCPAAAYLARRPECLVIGGYRHLLWSRAGACPAVERMWRLHLDQLGFTESRLVLDGLSSFVETLCGTAFSPPRALPEDSAHLCRDECLVLSLVASLQHGDEAALKISAGALAAPARHAETLAAAGDCAMRLKMVGQLLLPIPALVVADILAGPPVAGPAQPTMH